MKKSLILAISLSVAAPFIQAQDLPPMPIYANQADNVKQVDNKGRVLKPTNSEKAVKPKRKLSILPKKKAKDVEANSSYGNVSVANLAK